MEAVIVQRSSGIDRNGDTGCKRSLSKANCSTSFKLRSPSLNCLRLRRIFDLFDKNGDGTITVGEISQALNLLGLDADLSDLDSTIKSFIKPGNDGLEFEDFSALHKSLNDAYFGFDDEEKPLPQAGEMSPEELDLIEAFKVFDENGDGYISANELQAVLTKLGMSEGNEIASVQKMIVSVDRNHDGRVDFSEFKDMMRSVLVRND